MVLVPYVIVYMTEDLWKDRSKFSLQNCMLFFFFFYTWLSLLIDDCLWLFDQLWLSDFSSSSSSMLSPPVTEVPLEDPAKWRGP